MESVRERLESKTLDQISIDDLYDLINEMINEKLNRKRKTYSIEIKDYEKEQTILDAIDAAMKVNKRPTIKAMLERKRILKRLDPQELSDLLEDMTRRSLIDKDESKRKPAYFLSNNPFAA